MAGEFKPGDRVPTQAALPREEFWQTKQPLLGYIITCRKCGGTFSDADKRKPFCGICEPASTSSPDTPEAGAAGERDALREEIACRLNSLPLPDWSDADAIADAILPIIDRHTTKALETALRERDEARAGLARAATKRASLEFDVKALTFECDVADENSERLVARTLAAEAALSSEQSAHAETRKALEIALAPKCFSCGARVTEDCPRARTTPCGRQHLGGSRASLSPTQESTHADA